MSDLDRLFYWRGIAAEFFNFRGQRTQVPVENRVKILEAMGVDTSSEKSIALEAFDLDVKPWQSWLPPLAVAEGESEIALDLNFHPDDLNQTIRWKIVPASSPEVTMKSEPQTDSLTLNGEFSPESLSEVGDYQHATTRYSRRQLLISHIKPGYYALHLESDSKTQISKLAVVPSATYQPSWTRDKKRPWGFVIQLYSLRSENNWGIGDFSDLQTLIQYGASSGAGIIGLNPFHALQTNLEYDVSPYSPSDRRFVNPLYIDVEQLEDFRPSFKDKNVAAKAKILRESHQVNYVEVQELKYSVLLNCYKLFLQQADDDRFGGFKKFIKERGAALLNFAIYEVENNWKLPDSELILDAQLSNDRAQALSELCQNSEFAYSYGFHLYLQFVAELQLEQCQRLAIESGMEIGLIRDLAVGASGGGAEVVNNPELFCKDVSIGAPPDPLALTGQNWGMPPMDPAILRQSGFEHYIKLLRANMSHCGALRIDHAMSMMRLWWCPPDENADKGTYIYYPMRELLGILCLESHLNQCAIIGEDLGVVPDEFRDAISSAKVFSNKVFYFEKWHDTCFKHPKEYAEHALAMLNNHDVPTIRSWWNNTDLHLRNKLDLLEAHVEFDDLLQQRYEEKSHLVELLRTEELLPSTWLEKNIDESIDLELIMAIITFVGKTASKLFIIQLEDLLAMDEPVNVPGTYNEYPNWRRKLDKNVSEIFSNSDVMKMFSNINGYRQ